jgi:hypothetical protein
MEMFQQKNKAQISRYKIRRSFLLKQYNKVKMLMDLRILKGLFFIEILLRRIKLAKQIFVLDVEQGQEVFIPKDLSQVNMPMSFRYYDPIIKIILKKMSVESRQFFV